jgi:hypothetical protein
MRRPLVSWTGTCRAVATVTAMLSLLSADPAAAEKRVVLVVDNSAYQNVTQLDNPLCVPKT